MRILHTSDWHLGKKLNKFSRIDEQEQFLKELLSIADEEKIDAVIVAGDVYDTVSPPADAEKLFYYYAKELSLNGERPVIVIAGNHDSPERLTASLPLARDAGIIITGSVNEPVLPGKCGNFEIIRSEAAYLEISIKNEILSLIALPFISEKRIGRVLSETAAETDIRNAVNAYVKDMLDRLSLNFSKNSANVIAGHFYIDGGMTCNSEKPVQFGGSSAVSPDVFPENAHYLAMGHLHRPQKINCPIKEAYYSGSPLEYSLGEGSIKKVYIADIKDGDVSVKTRILSSRFPFKKISGTYGDVLASLKDSRCNLKENFYAFLEIFSKEPLTNTERKQLYETNPMIVEIILVLEGEREETPETFNKSLEEEFFDFYTYKNGVNPSKDLMRMFMSILEGEYDETAES